MINLLLASKTAGSAARPSVQFFVRRLLSVACVLAIPGVSRADLLAVDWSGNAWIIDECTGEAIGSTPTGYIQLNSLARDSQGRFYTVGSVPPRDIRAEQILMSIDPSTGIATPVAALPLNAMIEGTVRSLAFSPDDVLYATVRTPVQDGAVALYTIDIATGVTTFIGEMGVDHVQAMACSEDGIFYGIDELGRLGIIDVVTGLIAPIGDDPGIVGLDSLGFGPTGTLYAIQHDLHELYSLNLETGAARLIGVGNYGDVRGLEYIPGSSPAPVPPTVACSVAIPMLSERNGEFVDIGLQLQIEDEEDPSPRIEIRVYSNESEIGDAVFGEGSLKLRTKRDGNGEGRVYLILVLATDCCGATGFDCCTVVVPHDGSSASELTVAGEAERAELACRITGAPPDGYLQIGGTELP